MALNRVYLLMAQYNRADIPLEDVARDYLGLEPRAAAARAARSELPVPAFRAGSRQSGWLVSVQALAEYLDHREQEARAEWERRAV